jgi:hypothetical protein
MRDLAAGLIAIVLLVVAASLATTLTYFRRRRQRMRDAQGALGRTILCELPTEETLVLFSEDAARFYYGERPIDKDRIGAARVLINGAPIASIVARRYAQQQVQPTAFEDRPEGIARDRWDVAIETVASIEGSGGTGDRVGAGGTVLVECGAIRERVSQELARAVFDAVKREIERRNDR